jgi:hypothetical protein
MKSLFFLIVAASLLGGCSGVLDWCPDGLTPPPASDRVPAPHG